MNKELEKAAFDYINSDAVKVENMQLAFGDFINGAEWMQKKMIDKACEYLQKNMYATPIFEYDDDEQPVYYICASCCDSVEEFINGMCKAMED